MKDLKLIILMLAFQIGLGFTFNMVGVMSLGWILALAYTCINIFKTPLFNDRDFRYVSLMYLLLISVQCVAEYMAGNSLQNGMKGIAVDIVSFASFFFLLSLLCKDRKLVVWAIIGIILRMLIFGKESDSSAEEALAGEDATFLKFYLGPIILYLFLAISVFFKGKVFTYLFMYVGMFFVVAGARSLGLITFLIGVFVWLVRFKQTNITSMLRKYSFLFIAVFYVLYCIYVTNVIDGNISAGNNSQLCNSENPYNPLEIIRFSRSDSWVAINAFLDKPIWGYGSWAEDPGMKYHLMIANLTRADFHGNIDTFYMIPGHSVIFGKGAYNGIFVMVITIMLIWFFVKRGFKLMNYDNEYMFIILYMLFSLIWHSLFSPVGHIRDSFPLYFAVIFAGCFYKEKEKYIKKKSNI